MRVSRRLSVGESGVGGFFSAVSCGYLVTSSVGVMCGCIDHSTDSKYTRIFY